jgi:uncharacterized protein (TIGR00730 family)
MKKSNQETLEQIIKKCISENKNNTTQSRLCVISAELQRGFDLMKKNPKSITIFGSSRLSPETEECKRVEQLSKKIAEMGYSVVTGGGYGIMQAANKGAFEAENGKSLGINILLPFEQVPNKYLHDLIEFHHFFSRKVTLAYSAEAYIFCRGGFGTLDEFFEILTLKQTGKIFNIPIILYGKDFWKPFDDFFREKLLTEGKEVISKKDLDLYIISDDDEEILSIIKNAPVRTEVSTLFGLG